MYSHSAFQEEFTTCTHTVADNLLQGALEIRAVCTQYTADIMVAELKLAHSVKYQMTSGESSQYTLAVTGGTSHTVNLTEYTCSCSFRKT